MSITINDTLFKTEETADGYNISAPDNQFGAFVPGILTLFSRLPNTEENLPSQEQESKGDAFEALEAEMANETVRGMVGLHFDMQDMVAERALTALLTEPGTPVEVTKDDLTELARWFARCQHALAAMEDGDMTRELRAISMAWSEQLLELSI